MLYFPAYCRDLVDELEAKPRQFSFAVGAGIDNAPAKGMRRHRGKVIAEPMPLLGPPIFKEASMSSLVQISLSIMSAKEISMSFNVLQRL